ncbi:MAG: hypothetical protein RLZZ371_1269, partial [Pseudomonadota bacterium]
RNVEEHAVTAKTFHPIPARAAPVNTEGLVAWTRANLFGDWSTSLGTLTIVAAMLYLLPPFFKWLLVDAVWVPNYDSCHADGAGACWGVIVEKFRLIIFGRYPFDEQWRPLVSTLLLIGLVVMSCTRAFWKAWLAGVWVVVFALFFTIMFGGVFGLSWVETDRWGGLPLTILLSTLCMTAAFPIALLIALGRRSNLPAIRAVCTIYVELIRGVPLISVLFMASFMFPLLMPPGFNIDVLIRVMAGITLFAAAYMAEVIRGGLQAIPKANPAQNRAAAGTCDGGARRDEQLHRHLHGHLTGHHCEPVRTHRLHESGAELRCQLAPVQD